MGTTTAVALYAAIVATGGLGWQVYSYRLSERARVHESATKVDVDIRMGVAGTEPPLEIITVKVVNRSRHAIKLTGVSFRHQDKPGYELVSFTFAFSRGLPQTIEPQDAGEVMFDSARLRSGEDALDIYRPITAIAKLSTGDVFESPPIQLLRRAE
jgi:hypothetical protein